MYFANRDNNFLYSFRAEYASGKLTPIGRTTCGGKTPRNFMLDPTEHWMLVANQDSNLISVFARNPETGALAEEGKSFAAATPMCIRVCVIKQGVVSYASTSAGLPASAFSSAGSAATGT